MFYYKPTKIFIDIAIMGGAYGLGIDKLENVEVISIVQNSVSHVKSAIPSIPSELDDLRGTKLPDASLLLCGRNSWSNKCVETYLLKDYQSPREWTKIKTSLIQEDLFSSFLIDRWLLITGGNDWQNKGLDYEQFSIYDAIMPVTFDLPIPLCGHTTNIFCRHKIIICGGEFVVKKSKYSVKVKNI